MRSFLPAGRVGEASSMPTTVTYLGRINDSLEKDEHNDLPSDRTRKRCHQLQQRYRGWPSSEPSSHPQHRASRAHQSTSPARGGILCVDGEHQGRGGDLGSISLLKRLITWRGGGGEIFLLVVLPTRARSSVKQTAQSAESTHWCGHRVVTLVDGDGRCAR